MWGFSPARSRFSRFNRMQCIGWELICLMLDDIQERAADNTNTESQVRHRCHGPNLSHLKSSSWEDEIARQHYLTLLLCFFHSLSALVHLMTPRGSCTLIKLMNGSLIFLCMCLHTSTQLIPLDSEGEFSETLDTRKVKQKWKWYETQCYFCCLWSNLL